MNERLTPQSLDAEKSTLGAMLMSRDAVARATEILAANDLYFELHKLVFGAIKSLFDAGTEADYITVAQVLKSAGQLDAIGGPEYLTGLIEACPSSAGVANYAAVVLEMSQRRQIAAAAAEILDRTYQSDLPLAELKSSAEQSILDASRERAAGDCFAVGEITGGFAADLEAQIRNKGRVVGESTGFPNLDRKMGGLRPNHLVVLGARPGMGKSALALQIAYNVAKSGKPALFFSFEMGKEELIQRLACAVSQVEFSKTERGMVTDAELKRVMAALREIESVPLFIQDTPGMTTDAMRSRARRLQAQRKEPLGLIVVDYIQIVKEPPGKRAGSKADALGEIARELHIMGAEQDCTTLALAQLSREVERREDKRPILSDLRDSGSIEAEANRVLLLYRDGYYRRKDFAGDSEQDASHIDDTVAELIVAKNRNGATGTVRLAWNGPCVRFDNLAYSNQAGGELAPVYAPNGPWNGPNR